MSSSQKKDTGGKKNATKEGADTEHSDTKKSTTTPQEQAESLLPPLEVLEEDDDFQEFGEEEWDPSDMVEEDERLWQDDWDDELMDDQFCLQLRSEIEKVKQERNAKQ